MKYWNKKKKSRANWTRVTMGPTKPGAEALKLWCQRHASTGRFFYTNMFSRVETWNSAWDTVWEFEFAQDATAFRLIHG